MGTDLYKVKKMGTDLIFAQLAVFKIPALSKIKSVPIFFSKNKICPHFLFL
jgi:hypothetical protein